MSQVRAQLLAALPLYLDKSPKAEPALTLSYPPGGGTVTIARHRLRTQLATGGGVDLELAQHTLTSLAAALTTAGYVATVATSEGGTSALALLDVQAVSLDTPVTLQRFTAFLWRALVAPLAWALEDAAHQVQQGLLQGSVQTAERLWVDFWGVEFYGGLLRKAGEADRPYADRILREVQRLRLNNRAIEKIIQEDLGLTATVSNLHDKAWVVAVTPIQYLVGRKYARTTFEVLVSQVSAEVAQIIERNRAAGTLPFYEFLEVGGAVAPPGGGVFGSVESVVEKVRISPNLVYTVGVDPLSRDRLALSRPSNLASHLVTTRQQELDAPYFITGEAATVPFELDGSDLDGTDIILA